MTLDAFVFTIILPLLGISVVLTVVRMVKGPSLADRVVALELVNLLAIGIITVFALAVDQTEFFDIAVVIALVSFMATVGFARYIERQSERESTDDSP
jgi:multicomponent Na+:H+ antiporter subunit F